MNKAKIFIWIPVALGVLLLIVVKIHLYQFDPQTGDVRALLSREIPIAILGFFWSVIVFFSTPYWLKKNERGNAVQAFLSPLLWYACFVIGSLMGGAFMNAT